MNMQRRARVGSAIFIIVGVTFAGIAAVHFAVGHLGSFNSSLIDAAQAQSVQAAATIGIAFALLAVAVSAAFRQDS